MSSTLRSLTAATAVKRTDLLYSVLDPSGTPLDRKGTMALLRPFYDFVQDFGGDPTGAADQGALIESSLQTIADAGGGTLYFKEGVYKISRALQSTGTVNAQIRLPVLGSNTAQVSLRIQGAISPPTSGGSTQLPASGNTVFKSTLTGASGTAACIASGNTGRNNIHLELYDTIWQAPPDPTFTMLNFGYQQDVNIRRLLIHTGALNADDIVQPTNTNAIGLVMPQNQNPSDASVEDMIVWGYYVGMKAGELTLSDRIAFEACYHGCEVPLALHDIRLGHIAFYQCAYGLVGTGAAWISANIDYEKSRDAYQPWMDSIADIYDPTNVLRGQVTWHSSDLGAVGTSIIVTGAYNLEVSELGGARQFVDTVIADNFSGSVDGTALASHTITPTNTVGATWSALTGAWTIQSSKASTNTGAAARAIVDAGTGYSDVQLLCEFASTTNGEFGILFRVTDDSNYWLAKLVVSNGTFTIVEKVSGTEKVRASSVGAQKEVVDAGICTMSVWLNGSLIHARVGGTLLEYGSSVLQSNTKHGIYANSGSGTITANDFVVSGV